MGCSDGLCGHEQHHAASHACDYYLPTPDASHWIFWNELWAAMVNSPPGRLGYLVRFSPCRSWIAKTDLPPLCSYWELGLPLVVVCIFIFMWRDLLGLVHYVQKRILLKKEAEVC